MASFQRNFCFIWKKCWRTTLTLGFPILWCWIFAWGGIHLFELDPKKYKAFRTVPPYCQPRTVYFILIMASYWVSECLPLAVTALVPVFLLPLLGILSTEQVTGCYLNQSVMLLTSGCIIALAFEYSNLHTRIALKVITIVGTKIPMLLLGVIVTAMFLSMWMNNTSTTSMMVPIVYVIMHEFENSAGEGEAEPPDNASTRTVTTVSTVAAAQPPPGEEGSVVPSPSKASAPPKKVSLVAEDKRKAETRNIKIMFLLAIAWGSNIGGTGVITGTATNVIAESAATTAISDIKRDRDVINVDKCLEVLEKIEFSQWMLFNVVPMFFATILTWAILLVWFLGPPHQIRLLLKGNKPQDLAQFREDSHRKNKVAANILSAIRLKYSQLGPLTFHEALVIFFFLMTVITWVSGGKIGWFKFFWYKTLTVEPFNATLRNYPITYKGGPAPNTAVSSMFFCMLMFMVPKDFKYYKDFMKGGLAAGIKDPVLKWRLVETDVPWGPLILIGGGITIGRSITASGLGAAIGIYLDNDFLNNLEPYQYLIVILCIVAVFTTVASNTATASILSPVLVGISKNNGIHPLYLLVSATVSASYAFILPISTPPNAIVFDKSDMTQKDMALPGIIVTFATNLMLFFMIHTYDEAIYGFNDYSKNLKHCQLNATANHHK